jgi:hypothetical protein
MSKLVLSVIVIGMLMVTSCASEECSDKKTECCEKDSTVMVESDSLILENDSL